MKRTNLPVAALILAGGLGTRLRPITNTIPKPLVEVGGKPTIAYIVDEIVRNGINDIYVSVGYRANQIVGYLDDYKSPARIRYVREEFPLGTGGAVKLALETIGYKDSDIFMVYGDDLFTINMKEMYSLHMEQNADITLTIKRARKQSDIINSGVIGLGGNRVIKFVEKPAIEDAPSRFINIGRYIINTRICNRFPRKKVFSFERDFVQKNIHKLRVCAYLSKGAWYPTDNIERLGTARKAWSKGI